MRTAAIIPAYNEASRISDVLKAVCAAQGVNEVIVVVDGGDDCTAAVARSFSGVKVIELKKNVGKGGALVAGVNATSADVLIFVDADLAGLKPEHLSAVLLPIAQDRQDMVVGVFSDGRFWSDTAQRMSPDYSGQRALRRWLFEAVHFPHEMRFGIEIGLNHAAKSLQARVGSVALPGVTHHHKEEKWGIVRGAAARARMYAEMGKAYVKVHQHERNASRLRH